MKIQFDSSLDYQRDAIRAITGIFQGQEICESNFTVYSPEFLAKQQNIAFNEIARRAIKSDPDFCDGNYLQQNKVAHFYFLQCLETPFLFQQ